ncbi:MAG TPA: ABC transporter substrate-binding protein [Polyangia bacterium]|nr:ABC transporter substrate-binding protein [Polyangia bacterium]
MSRARGSLLAALVILAGCGDDPPGRDGAVSLGLLLSYSGDLAAGSINSERALLLAVEAANQAGGLGGRPITVVANDTGSAATKVASRAHALVDAGVSLFIGPDSNELAVELKPLLADRTVIMPSFATADWLAYKPSSWFVMGASAQRFACELQAQLQADGRHSPLVIADPTGYSSVLGWELVRAYGLPLVQLPTHAFPDAATVDRITSAGADSYVLVAVPHAATALFYGLGAVGALGDPARWYLSPTLHTPALLDTIPRGGLAGARGVATGTAAGGQEFRDRFTARWQDRPMDDAYPFYDAGAVAVLALQRALHREGAIPTGTGLAKHVVAVTSARGVPVRWNELERGLALLRQGQEVAYVGVTGVLEFDLVGQTSTAASVSWWTVGASGFVEVPRTGACTQL